MRNLTHDVLLGASEPDEHFRADLARYSGLAEMHDEHGPAARTIMFIFVTLLGGGLLRFVIKIVNEHMHFSLPYTVLIMLLGFGSGWLFTERILHEAYFDLAKADPHVLLHIFLPVLIFESAFSIETHLFFQLVVQIIVLASAGLGKFVPVYFAN